MKKLLVLALLGLGLGAGAWKAQNPQGTLDDFRSQAQVTVERLKTGVSAVVDAKPGGVETASSDQAGTGQTVPAGNPDALVSRLSALELSLQSLASDTMGSVEPDTLNTRLSLLEQSVESLSETRPASNTSDASEASDNTLDSRLAELEQDLATLTSDGLNKENDSSATDSKLDARFTALEQSLAALGKHEQANTITPEVLETTLETTLETKLDAKLDSRFTSLEQSLESLDGEISASREAQASDEQTKQALVKDLTDLGTAVASIRSDVDAAAAGGDAGIVRLDAIDSRLDLLVRRLDEQSQSNDNDFQSVRDALKTVGDDVEQAQNTNGSRNADINDQLATLAENSESLGLRLDTFNASAAALSVMTASVSEGDTSAVAEGNSDEASTEGGDPSASPSETSNSTKSTGAGAGAGTGTGTNANTDALVSLNSSIDERFNALENKLSTVNSDSRRIASLTDQLAAANQQIDALQAKNNESELSITQINTAVSDLQTAGESLAIDSDQTEIRQQLAMLQTQLESNENSNDTQQLESLLDTTRTRIQTLEQRVQELPASSSEADAAQQIQSALESQIVALERRLESVNKADPALANTLSNVQERVAELASKEYVTQEDLRAQNETRAVQYKIYFDRNSVDITDDAAVVLDSFITQEQNRTTGVSIFGFTDRRGSASYNQQLALQRATKVRSYLIQNGFDYTKIKALNGLGEDAAAAVQPDNADDAQQRVVVLYAAQP